MVLRTLSGDSPDAAAAQRRVFDALPAAVFTCDARARLTYVNPVWRDLLGYPEDHPDRAIARASIEKLLVRRDDGDIYCQPCVSPVWDTALAAHAMIEVGSDGNVVVRNSDVSSWVSLSGISFSVTT